MCLNPTRGLTILLVMASMTFCKKEDSKSTCDQSGSAADCSSPSGSVTPTQQPQSSQNNNSSNSSSPIPGSDISFADISQSGYTISWLAAQDDATSSTNLEYQLIVADTEAEIDTIDEAEVLTGGSVVLAWTKNTVTYAVSGRSGLEKLAYAVIVRDEEGHKSLYPPQSVTTLDPDAPTAGTTIAFSAITDIGFTSTWGAASSNISASSDLEYKGVIAASTSDISTIDQAQAITGTGILFDWTKNKLIHTVTDLAGLTGNTSYAVAVLVRNSNGTTAIYSPQVVTTNHHRLIFATATRYAASALSDVTTIDGYCNAAKAAGRGTFKAMLASTQRKACLSANCGGLGLAEHVDWVMAPDTNYENRTGQLVWKTNSLGIVDSNNVKASVDSSAAGVWTGIKSDWSRDTVNDCQGWTSNSNSVSGAVGNGVPADSRAWGGADIQCSIGPFPIYCVEQ